MSVLDYKIVYDSEIKLLGCIIEDPNLVFDIDPKFFNSTISVEIYNAILNLKRRQNNITIDNIVAENGKESIREYVEGIINFGCDIKDFNLYKEKVKEGHLKEELSKTLDNLRDELGNKNVDIETYEKIRKKINYELDAIQGDNLILQSMVDLNNEYEKELKRRSEGVFYSYGDSRLDNVTVGAIPGTMTTIYGATGSGKSALALATFNKQINKQIPAMYVSLEMDRISTMDRLIAMRCKVSTDDLYMREGDPEYNEEIIKAFQKEREVLEKHSDKFYIVDKAGLSLNELEYLITKAKEKMGVDYMIVTIDLWTMIKEASSAEAKEIEKAINITHEICKRTNCHFILVVQANRELDNKKPNDYDDMEKFAIRTSRYIKNSGAIEERSRAIFGMWRPKYWQRLYFPDDERNETEDDIMYVALLKANQRATGKVLKYIFVPEYMCVLPFMDKVYDENEDVIQSNPQD